MYYSQVFDRTDPLFSIYDIDAKLPRELFLVDRTETVIFPHKGTVYDSCKLDTNICSKSFEQVCLERLKELESLQPFKVMWSGGLDSTLILRLALDHKFDFEVYLSDASILEHPFLYRQLRKENIILHASSDITLDNKIILTGELGDQIFGSDILMDRKIKDVVDKNITEVYTYLKKYLTNYWATYWYNLIISTSPISLEYVYDFWWWFNFNFKYQTVWFRGQMPFQTGPIFKRVHHHFFEGAEFQRWSCSNLSIRRVSTMEQYKPQIRGLLAQLGDKKYAQNKKKVGSLNPGAMLTRPAGVNSDNTILNLKKVKRGKMVKKYIYGPLMWNVIDHDDDSGNYWWNGSAPVDYDEMEIPIDSLGLQCLPLSCPVHPNYSIKDSVFNEQIKDYLPSFKEWEDWFDINFIEIDKHRIKREILRWYVKDPDRVSKDFYELQKNIENLDEMVDAVWPQDENK